MPKYLPKPLTPTLERFDEIIDQQSRALAGALDAKVSIADLIRLYQFRLDLADRYEAMNPRPALAVWIDPAWALPQSELPDAIVALDQARQQYLEALRNPDHDAPAANTTTESHPEETRP